MSESDKIAVVLLNLGGPEKVEDVRPFLYNLFSDRLIIRLGPPFLQKPIAWWIAKRRAPKSQGYYRQIGGGSPLNRITGSQCAALEERLAENGGFRVVMAMRYWRPFCESVVRELAADGVRRIVALTLYPHYSIATTGSSLVDLRNHIERLAPEMEVAEVDAWPEQPDYVRCLAERIKAAIAAGGDSEVVYSAHSLPKKFIDEGDPYLDHLGQTISSVEKLTGKAGHLCFQSRSGPVEWLAPSTPETIDQLAARGCRRMVVVPISFVSDHVETLCEIDIQYREQAAKLGVELVRTPSLNTDPLFISALHRLTLDACKGKGWL